MSETTLTLSEFIQREILSAIIHVGVISMAALWGVVCFRFWLFVKNRKGGK